MSSPRLRILSVVTLVSPFGDYGGPVRVAVNQASALRDLGHEVTIAGAHRGFPEGPPEELAGTPTALFPARTLMPRTGFAGLGSPELWRWLRQNVKSFDVVHVHVARDLVSLPAAWIARRARVPYVLQPHGMIDHTTRWLARPLDAAMTRPALRDARHVLYLNATELDGLREVTRDSLSAVLVPNGVPLPEVGADENATSVLFLARLAPRKRPLFFVEMARRLASVHPDADFVLVGPDEGEGASVSSAIANLRDAEVPVQWRGALPPEETLDVMRQACAYVLPSVNEPNGMTVLEAMSLGLPVVVTDTCGLAAEIEGAGAGVVVDASIEGLTEGVSALLADRDEARLMGGRGRDYVARSLSMSSIARQLESLYLA